MTDPFLPRRRQARRRLIGYSIVLIPAWILLTFLALGGLLGALVERPAALGWAIAGCGLSVWLATMLWHGLTILRHTPSGRPLTRPTAERIARVCHAVGTGLLVLAASCATGEILALIWLFAAQGSSTDQTIVATSLASAALVTVAGRHARRTARQLALR